MANVDSRDGRRQVLQLTQSGYELHDRLIAIAPQRESLILADLPEEIAGLTTALRRLHSRLPELREFSPDDATEVVAASR